MLRAAAQPVVPQETPWVWSSVVGERFVQSAGEHDSTSGAVVLIGRNLLFSLVVFVRV